MSVRTLTNLFATASLLFSQFAFCATTPSDMSSYAKPTAAPQNLEEREKTKDKKGAEKKQAQVETVAKVVLPDQIPKSLDYFHPGILVFKDGTWQGSDYLLNLSQNIGVYISILKPQNETLEITEEQIKKSVEEVFAKANIKPFTLAYEHQAPFPAFEVEILVYPIEKGYTACCNGRLFESVTLPRITLDEGMVFEAITWEKRSLIVGPQAKFAEQLLANVKEIAEAFTERFQAHEKMTK